MLPEFFSVLRDPTGKTALAIGCALCPLSELDTLTSRSWQARVRKAAQGKQVLLSRAASVLPLLKAAHRDPVRRSGEGMPFRIRHAAERRRLLEAQKAELRAELMHRYSQRDEAAFLDSIPGSNAFYNALTLALIGDFQRYDDPRAVVKLAGSEVNHYASGDWSGTSRISHRGRSALRAAAYQQARQLVARNEDFRARFHTLIHRTTKPKLATQEAYVAVMNSYLRIAHSLVTRRELYIPLAERMHTLET
jgi:transposase